MFRQKKVIALIPSAGSGNRMGADVKKQYLKLDGKEILNWTIKHLLTSEWIDEAIVIVPAEDADEVEHKISEWILVDKIEKNVRVVVGGATRQDSVYCGLKSISENEGYVLIHDGVRPFVPIGLIERYLESLDKERQISGAVAGLRVTDTLKKVDTDKIIVETVDRMSVWSVQTPQVFEIDKLIQAHAFAQANAISATDDAALLELLGEKVTIIESTYENIKITKPFDLVLAESIFKDYRLE